MPVGAHAPGAVCQAAASSCLYCALPVLSAWVWPSLVQRVSGRNIPNTIPADFSTTILLLPNQPLRSLILDGANGRFDAGHAHARLLLRPSLSL
jgi:hypothetical protein